MYFSRLWKANAIVDHFHVCLIVQLGIVFVYW